QKGIEVPCTYYATQTCDFTWHANCVPGSGGPTQFWSTEGQAWLDFSNSTTPVIHLSDGTVQVFSASGGVGTNYSQYQTIRLNQSHLLTGWKITKSIDRNGNTTQFAMSGTDAKVTDPQGRVTTYSHDSGGRVTQITQLGSAGHMQTWTLNWSPITWQP